MSPDGPECDRSSPVARLGGATLAQMRRSAAGAVLLLACAFCGGHDDSAASSVDGGMGDVQGVRWQDLYAAYFGATGQASCSKFPGSCHGSASALGVATSGFVCGSSSDACWQGMTQGQPGYPPLVPPGVTDPTQTTLWKALYKGAPVGGTTSNNMPQNVGAGGAPGYTFSSSDLARIGAWIEDGAPNN